MRAPPPRQVGVPVFGVECVPRHGRAQWVKEPSQPRPPNASRHVLPAVVASGGVKESRVEILLNVAAGVLGSRASGWPRIAQREYRAWDRRRRVCGTPPYKLESIRFPLWTHWGPAGVRTADMDSAVARARERGNMRAFLQKGKVSFYDFWVRRALKPRGAQTLHGYRVGQNHPSHKSPLLSTPWDQCCDSKQKMLYSFLFSKTYPAKFPPLITEI